MPVTNYYSFGGSIVGEETVGGSGYRAYGTDALGSVVATYDDTGSLENQYRYSPYGRTVLSDEVAATPRFTWVGALGYAQTGRGLPDLYISARHYSSSLAAWSTLDPMWPGSTPFAYANGNPTNWTDRSGELTCVDEGSFQPELCGHYRHKIDWRLAASEADGWIIQHIRGQAESHNCGNPRVVSTGRFDYWEAWLVHGGQAYQCPPPGIPLPALPGRAGWLPLPHDNWNNDAFGGFNTWGSISFKGTAKFLRRLPGSQALSKVHLQTAGRPGWVCNFNIKPSANLWTWALTDASSSEGIRTPPDGWTDEGLERRLDTWWNCCPGTTKQSYCYRGCQGRTGNGC